MNISYLADNMELVPMLAEWSQSQWGYLSPERSLENHIEQFRKRNNRSEIPLTFIGFAGDTPVGMASLVECDMYTHSHLTPWLASVYVVRSHRNRGIGSALVNQVIETAGSIGYPTLYLWTPGKKTFYATRGWTLIETTTYRNEHADVMSFSISHEP